MSKIKYAVLSALENIPSVRLRRSYWYDDYDGRVMNLDLYAQAKEKTWTNIELIFTYIFSIKKD